jgi:deoxycytidylate deaminase
MARNWLDKAIEIARQENGKSKGFKEHKHNNTIHFPPTKSSRQSRKYSITAIVTSSCGRSQSIGRNSYTKTHPLQKRYADMEGHEAKQYLHAEVSAICKFISSSGYGAKPYAIYVARVDSRGNTKLAKPCRICERAIKEAGIKEIHYTV